MGVKFNPNPNDSNFIYDQNLWIKTTSKLNLQIGQKFLNPEDVAIDPFGNILLSDMALGTIVLSSDLTEVNMNYYDSQ